MSLFCSKCGVKGGSSLKKGDFSIIHCYLAQPYISTYKLVLLYLCPVCYLDFLSLNKFNLNKGDSKNA